MFCAILKKCVYGPLFFVRTTVNSETYLAMLQNWLMELCLRESEQTLLSNRIGHHLTGISM